MGKIERAFRLDTLPATTLEEEGPPITGISSPPFPTVGSSSAWPTLATPDREGRQILSDSSNIEPLAPFQTRLNGGTRDLFVIPIPKRLQWDRQHPPKFTLLLNGIFGFSATFTVANLYYPQSTLIEMANSFDVPYDRVTNIPTMLQAAYAASLLLVCPMGDLVRRRQLVLLLVLCSSLCSLALALVPSIEGFEAVSFALGMTSVTPQVLLPLAADLAPANRRASAISIVMSGLLLGILVARVLAGVIGTLANIRVIYWMSLGLQSVIWVLLWATVPDYPAKNPHLRYGDILGSMAKYTLTEPLLAQTCLISMASSAIYACFWTCATFLLGELYGFDSLKIGLVGLAGFPGVCSAPFVGRLVDHLVPWLGVLIGVTIVASSQGIFTAAGGVSLVAVIIPIFLLDLGHQTQQVSNSTRVFSINAAARARLSAVYIFSIFCGQLTGTKLGTSIYLKFGYRASGGLCLGFYCWIMLILVSRGPHLPSNRWFGWAGGWELRKSFADRNLKLEAEKAEREAASEKGME
ncbi:MFS general substrate transporter [Meredithblackwellia eburnea MCA 4105]